MESAIQTVVKVFLKSSKGKENLGGKDFQSLVKSQLGNIMTDADSSEAVKEMRQDLDSNHDGKVSFEEYMKLVGYLANALSQQRALANETPAPGSTAEPVAEDAPAQEKKEETAGFKVEAAAKVDVEPKEEPKVEEETHPEAPKEEEKPAAVAEEVKEEVNVGEEEKAEEAAEVAAEEKPAAAAEEDGEEKKTEEETS
ncbi:S100 calcium binding protein U [Lampris incognitus]|uniref:S100 calcium binding protein U n=1 Tax=Lampris incognitus TaxID=2546036 RepID=UPI0024B4D1A4|nr:S100 calcium binding protein U [Lampris incognitus]